MKQVKTFTRLVESNNDDEVNEFMKDHKVLNVRCQIMQGFTYTSETNYVNHIDSTIKPLAITTIIYEASK